MRKLTILIRTPFDWCSKITGDHHDWWRGSRKIFKGKMAIFVMKRGYYYTRSILQDVYRKRVLYVDFLHLLSFRCFCRTHVLKTAYSVSILKINSKHWTLYQVPLDTISRSVSISQQ